MKIHPLYVLIVLGFFIAGCTSSRKLNETTQFATRISNSGLKHFEVSLRTPASDQHYNQPGATQAEYRQSPTRLKSLLEKAADVHLAKNNFCQSGYWVLSLDVLSPTVHLRGECNEKASEEEREKFPDTIAEW